MARYYRTAYSPWEWLVNIAVALLLFCGPVLGLSYLAYRLTPVIFP